MRFIGNIILDLITAQFMRLLKILFFFIGFRGVQGHVNGELPWAHCDECVDSDMAKLVGEHVTGCACNTIYFLKHCA